jgi:hypothetical protein
MSADNEPAGTKKSADSTIVAAIITGIVTIMVTAITVFGGHFFTQPTSTVTPSLVSSLTETPTRTS